MDFINKLEKAYHRIKAESTSRYYHGSPVNHGDELKVLPYGHNIYGQDFGGVFLSKEDRWGHIGNCENYWYYIDLKESEILSGKDLYSHYDKNDKKITKILDIFDLLELSEEELDDIWNAWQIQSIQGQIAKILGYKAFETPDERGVAYLLVGPNILKKEK
jgi:hypothetical protein